MTSLLTLSELTRSYFSLWALLLCLVCIFGIVLSVTQKRYRPAVFALPAFACGYLLWQVLFDLHLFGGTEGASAVSRKLGGLPWLWCPAALSVLTAAALWILLSVIRDEKRSVTPTAVKHCLDQMPCGVCCWRDSGRVLFSNICMNRLCIAVTGSPLLNGNQFYQAAAGGILTVGEKIWRFTCREILFDGERLHEMIASDVTAEYTETQVLEKDKAELSRLNRELREYTLSIDDAVRRQEILQAKVNIHDEMNRLMLSTMAADGEDAAALDPIFALWEQNALLVCMEADEVADTKAAARIEKLAEALKIRLIWRGTLPAALSEKQRSLFFSAAQEAIANAAKHAQAKTMEISFQQTGASFSCFFTNDGRIPDGEVRFTGGLANLALLAAKQGARICVHTDGTFSLSLQFPENQPNG
ncbi:MAG: hypothetical protein IKI50_02525 [Clostridia bacterium]|nr:hypothetical protein [Clostridia bacterium]